MGDSVAFNDVLMVARDGEVQIGTPHLANVVVTGQIIQQAKGKKVLTYKMKRRKNYRRFKGHRQEYTTLKISDIALS